MKNQGLFTAGHWGTWLIFSMVVVAAGVRLWMAIVPDEFDESKEPKEPTQERRPERR